MDVNVWDVVIICLIAAAVILGIRHMVRNRGNSCYGCTGNCSECEYRKDMPDIEG